jgi:hypothetical protein
MERCRTLFTILSANVKQAVLLVIGACCPTIFYTEGHKGHEDRVVKQEEMEATEVKRREALESA